MKFLGDDRDALTRRSALTGVVISATVLSYSTLHHRAITIGIPEWSAWFYPILYDAFILGASRTWQNQALSDPTRRLAKWATLGTIAAAVAAFVIEFWAGGLFAVLGALMIPAVMAWALVLTSRSAADRKSTSERVPDVGSEPTVVPVPTKPAEPVAAKLEGSTVVPERPIPMKRIDSEVVNAAPVTVKVPEKTATISKIDFEPVTNIDKRTWVHAQLDAGVEVTGAMINSKFGGRNGSRLLKSVQTERASRNGVKV